MTEINNFNDFIPLALRTESKIEEVKTNKQLLCELIRLNTITGEILDAIKKGIFYSNYSKLLDNGTEYAFLLNNSTYKIGSMLEEISQSCTSSDELSDIVSVNARVLHAILGASTENSELMEILLHSIESNEPVDRVHIAEEMADGGIGGWYGAVLCDELQIDYYRALTNVINKLMVRFPDAYSDELAANRDLESERKELEKDI